MPIVIVKMLKGRTREQKAGLAQAITEAMVQIGKAKPEKTSVLFEELDREDWATGGTLLADQTS